jgi:quinohemoprotein ethanol dehydrogenase
MQYSRAVVIRCAAVGGLVSLQALLSTVALGQSAPSADSQRNPATAVAQVDARRLAQAEREPDQWFTAGRDAGGTYYSPLDSINDQNVTRLGFAWDYQLGTRRGLEATPVVVDGVMYASGNWGRVYAVDAATGRELWRYDPQVDGQYGRYACCDVVNRGLAVWKGRVYVASVDGYLHAIDARTGQRIWRVDTLPERAPNGFPYAVTGAPVLAGDDVVIGNGGADFKGARGSISAYDLQSGAFKWRFYTVPRDPRLGKQDQPHLEAAVKTWPTRYDWAFGGGGTAWDGLAYDPDLRLAYLGTANASPYHGENEPAGRKDELFVASIIAVHVDTGQMAWYYQEIPGEGWDYDATMKLVLAEVTVGSKRRQVIMQASKNGYFYVLDRATGEFLSGRPFAYANWTKGLDPQTHRPMTEPGADWARAPTLIFPSAIGAHSWQPMSFDPKTALVYIPVIDAAMVYIDTSKRRAGLIEGNFDLAFFLPEDYDPKELKSLYGSLPTLAELLPGKAPPKSRGLIRAFDPQSGKIAWEQQTQSLWDGGVLSTAGNLVVQGDSAGDLSFYAADTGKLLNKVSVGTSIMAAPMTYRIGGVQYISVMAGYGGGLLASPFPQGSAAYKYGNEGRIVTFRMDGGVTPKPALAAEPPQGNLPTKEGTPVSIDRGEVLYNRYCSRCHVFGRGLLPDLRRLSPVTHQLFYQIVLNGIYQGKGMARWDDVLTRSDAEAIHAYLIDQAWQLEHDRASRAESDLH